MSSSSTAPIDMKRKSWLRRSKGSPGPLAEPRPQEIIVDETNPDRYRPVQFSPNRIATLYVTPSERNLYLAAMSQLDNGPPPLPLWSEPAPTLPPLPSTRTQENGHHNESSPNWNPFHNSPKFVTSPDMPDNGEGLMVRDEFRQIPSRSVQHAILSLNPPSEMRFTGFTADTLLALDRVMMESWPMGVRKRSESVDGLKARGGSREGSSWTVRLGGTAWTRKGHQELDSIRLLVSVFTVLRLHSWTLVDSLQAAGTKIDSHNLLLSKVAGDTSTPSLFFALSLPLPDRISLISPPPKSTTALISAIRAAIMANTHHIRSDLVSKRASAATNDAHRVTWNQKGQGGVKLEGWVHQGVYRFWLAGMRRLGGRVKKRAIENLHTQLLLAIVESLASLHFELVASLPLRPVAKGRDILIFSSTPTSGLSYRDAYRSVHQGSEPEIPILVERPPIPPPHHDVRRVDPENRILPWTSVLAEGPAEDGQRSGEAVQGPPIPPPDGVPPDTEVRAPSVASSQPLIPTTGRESPRPRNVLVKRSSLRRHRSLSATRPFIVQNAESIRYPPQSIHNSSRQASDSSHNQVGQIVPVGQETRTMVDPPATVGHPAINRNRRISLDGTVGSSDDQNSAYVDADEDLHDQPLRLGVPLYPEAETTVPLRDVPGPNRAAVVEVGGGIGIPSMHGSVGYLGARSTKSGHTGSTMSGGELERRASGQEIGRSRDQLGSHLSVGVDKGKGRETLSPEFGGGGPSGVGSARTRVSLGSK